MDDIDRLEFELEAAREAVKEHLYSGVAIRHEGGPWRGRADTTPVDQAWLEHHDQLKVAAQQALTAANQARDAFLDQMRHQGKGRPPAQPPN